MNVIPPKQTLDTSDNKPGVNKLIFIFLDGVGLGEDDADNPLATAKLPFLASLIGAPLLKNLTVQQPQLLCQGIDACLGVSGIPQSATGQTALLTGCNAARHLGYHLPAFPNKALIKLIQQDSLLKRAKSRGLRATFANAYTPQYFTEVAAGRKIHSVTTHCVLAADIPFNMPLDLERGRAVYWDITREHWQDKQYSMPRVSASDAGQHLANLARHYDIVLFECFLPDLIGHRRDHQSAQRFLTTLDHFLHGLITHKASDVNVLISSDHGNIEDLSRGQHTQNLVPLIVIGPDAPDFTHVDSICGIVDCILPAVMSAVPDQITF